MTVSGRDRVVVGATLALLALIVALDALEGPKTQYVGLIVSVPLIAAALIRPTLVAVVGTVSLVTAAVFGGWFQDYVAGPQTTRLVAIALAAAVAVYVARVRRLREAQLVVLANVAEVAQHAVLRPVPGVLGNVRIATDYVSAAAEALIGGDLYEALDTEHGFRAVVGDVRGKGLDAVWVASVVLGSFREAAHRAPTLADVASAMEESARRVLADEDFVTAVLVQVGSDGTTTVVNCGHPPPLLVGPTAVVELEPPAPSPPLGMGADPKPLDVHLAHGDRLLLYTDGAAEARSRTGEWFRLHAAVARTCCGDLTTGLHELRTELERHVGGHLEDDVALLLIERA